MQSLITDLYPYIGNFLDNISLLNYVMTSKSIYDNTIDYKNSRINKELLSKIKKVVSKLDLRFGMELCYGNDLPEDRYDILKNVGKKYGMSSCLVYPEILEKNINFNTTFMEEERYPIKFCLSDGKTYNLLFVLRIIDDYYPGDASIHIDILKIKIYVRYSRNNQGKYVKKNSQSNSFTPEGYMLYERNNSPSHFQIIEQI